MKGAGEVEEGSLERVRDGEEDTERGAELVVVDLNEADRSRDTDGEGTVSDGTVGGTLHDDCFGSRNGLSAEGCSKGVSKGGTKCRRVVGDGVENGVVEASGDEYLLRNVC